MGTQREHKTILMFTKKRNTLYIMYSPLRKEYIQDLHYNFSTSSLDKPVAPIINSVGEPTCFK